MGPRPPPDFCSHRVTLTQLRRSAERVRVEGELGLVDSDRLAGVCEPAPSPGRPFRRPFPPLSAPSSLSVPDFLVVCPCQAGGCWSQALLRPPRFCLAPKRSPFPRC